MKKLKHIIYLAAPPLIVLAVMLAVFHAEGMYPFGEGSVSWCDMNQQTIPLLINLKDILDGKSSIFLNMRNAGGMNFYGVFFFFLASPFSLLVRFVDKQDMMTFVNILVILKLMTSSLTAAIYFSVCKKRLDPFFGVALSIMYAFCGYGMLFYQNLIWLDMMYIMPLLALALDILIKKRNNIPYIIVITAMLIVNYYISYMTVVYILLFMGIYALRHAKSSRTSEICAKFISGSLIGALLSAAVWLPCFIQYLSSGRRRSVFDTLAGSRFISHYQTVLPLLFCSAFMFIAVGFGIAGGSFRSRSSKDMLPIFGMLSVPFFIEPVNIMWHTGNYMSFPARYGFITVFAGLMLCSDCLIREKPAETADREIRIAKYALGTVAGAALILFCGIVSARYFEQNWETLSYYTDTLWGSNSSLEGLTEMFTISLICYGTLFLMYKKGFAPKRIFALMLCLAAVCEAAVNIKLYMTTENRRIPEHNQSFQEVAHLSDKIEDGSFYRIATDRKIMDYNMVGALGYPSLSHYTSLTDGDFMFAQKRLGYTTVWMEVGSCGGTELTDALYSVGYRIVREENADGAVYSSGGYSIVPTQYKVGLGLAADRDLSGCEEIPADLTRAQVQQYLFSEIFGGEKPLITEYPLDENESRNVDFSDDKYVLTDGSKAVYSFDVIGKQSIYADCFDRLSNALREDYFDSLSISVNDRTVTSEYPRTTDNGVLKLGEFEDQRVEVTIRCSKDISCYSFGVFGLDLDLLEETLQSTDSIGLTENRGRLTGNYTSDRERTCLMTVPYSDGFTVKINGKKIEYRRVFSDFIAFGLPAGESSIEISYLPKGFVPGMLLTVLGAAALAVYIIFGKKIKLPDRILKAEQIAVTIAGAAVIAVIYIMPVMISLCGYL